MNIWKQSIEEIAADRGKIVEMELFPQVPPRFSVQTAACIMDVSEQTVQRMVERNELAIDANGNIMKTALIRYCQTHSLADLPVLDAPAKAEIREKDVI